MKQDQHIVYDVRKNRYWIHTDRELETLVHKYKDLTNLGKVYPFSRIWWRRKQKERLNFFTRLYYLIRFYAKKIKKI